MIHKTEDEMIDAYSNPTESFRIIFEYHFDELIDELYNYRNLMINDDLQKIAQRNNKNKPIYIKEPKFDDDENNKKIDFNNIIINI